MCHIQIVYSLFTVEKKIECLKMIFMCVITLHWPVKNFRNNLFCFENTVL